MTQIVIEKPDTTEMQTAASSITGLANALTVKDDGELIIAVNLTKEIKNRIDMVQNKFKEPVKLAYDAHKSIVALRDSVLTPLKNAEICIKAKMGIYQMEQEQIRQESERKAQEEKERAEAEARRKHNEELAKAQKEAEERALAEAAEAEAKGDKERAEKILTEPLETDFVPPPASVETPPSMPEPVKINGASFGKVVRWRITHEDSVPRFLCSSDSQKINAYTRTMGMKAKVDGVKFWEEIKPRIIK